MSKKIVPQHSNSSVNSRRQDAIFFFLRFQTQEGCFFFVFFWGGEGDKFKTIQKPAQSCNKTHVKPRVSGLQDSGLITDLFTHITTPMGLFTHITVLTHSYHHINGPYNTYHQLTDITRSIKPIYSYYFVDTNHCTCITSMFSCICFGGRELVHCTKVNTWP